MKVLKYFLLFILLIHVSCKKQTAATIIARGFVKDKLSLAPIPNVPISYLSLRNWLVLRC